MPHLKALETEAIYIMREVTVCFKSPCMFYSIDKDSTMMLAAQKAFAPDKVHLTTLHEDTTRGFR
jgi:sulfate adenylyltransferase subunit 2